MSMFNELTRAVTDTAKSAAKMSSDMVEVTRLTVAISAEEDKIDKQFYEIGKKVYENYDEKKEIADNEVSDLCAAVKDMERNITEMKTRIFSLKKIKECPSCKEILDLDMVFCYKCGEKQPIVEIIIEENDVPDCENAENEESDNAGTDE